MSERLDTHHRALRVNLDPLIYGTFAEIGAGQEVARWFLQVGGAAGTVAKTISAYDMKFSDEIYGKAGRYVSRDRLLAMLDREYGLLIERLDADRGENTRFFVFADTVSARNFAGTNECHGWMGLRFQLTPRAEPHDILLHVALQDHTNLLQQQALGILGVNLVHAAFFEAQSLVTLLAGLRSDLSLERVEIDVLETAMVLPSAGSTVPRSERGSSWGVSRAPCSSRRTGRRFNLRSTCASGRSSWSAAYSWTTSRRIGACSKSRARGSVRSSGPPASRCCCPS